MTGLIWRRIAPGRYATGRGWEVRRIGPGAWSLLRWHEERKEWLIFMDTIPTKTQAMALADRLLR